MTGREECRNSSHPRIAGEFDPEVRAVEPNVGDHEVDHVPVESFNRFVEVVDRCDHLVTEVGEHRFGVERRQRLILNDEDPLDDPLALTEQHRHSDSNMTPTSQRTNQNPVPQRIAKMLARAGIASRREIERMIADGRIAVNGEKLTTPATLLADLSGVTVDGRPVRAAAATRLFRFYKPQATITAANDPKGRATIYDRLPKGLPRLMPVGRLDFMTEGLLLLTNDGEFKRQLELPRTEVVRTYRARVFGIVTQAQLEKLAEGITIDGVRYGSIDANLERRTGRNAWIEMSLTEGKNREVRRVLAHFGLQVSRLIRTAYGPFTLAGLEPGAVDETDPTQVDAFRRTLK